MRGSRRKINIFGVKSRSYFFFLVAAQSQSPTVTFSFFLWIFFLCIFPRIKRRQVLYASENSLLKRENVFSPVFQNSFRGNLIFLKVEITTLRFDLISLVFVIVLVSLSSSAPYFFFSSYEVNLCFS